jgi:hypothetical protein
MLKSAIAWPTFAAQALGQLVRFEGGLLRLAGGRRRFRLCG